MHENYLFLVQIDGAIFLFFRALYLMVAQSDPNLYKLFGFFSKS